jgi:N-acetylglucosamine-6-phosphate deacetylase
MTMHLEGPWLSALGKKKGKQKFRNAEEAKRHRELTAEWEKLVQLRNHFVIFELYLRDLCK